MSIKILGIDPGSRALGFGVIQANKDKQVCLGFGTLYLKDENFPNRIKKIFLEISTLIDKYRPDVLSIEQVFVHKNPGGALKLGQARGAIIAACARLDLPVYEYAAKDVKKSVVGYGGADKEQVQHMIKVLLKVADSIQADAADALAIALTHAQHHFMPKELISRVKKVNPSRGKQSWRKRKDLLQSR